MQIHQTTTLYFIRHAQTPSNLQGIKQGTHVDEYLSTAGILSIQHHLIPIIKTLDLSVLYTSYLRRAEETAAMLRQSLKDPIPVYHDSRLRERDFGSLSGKHITEIKKIIPDFVDQERTQTYDYRPFGGESVDQVKFRMLSAIHDIAENHDHQYVGIITHGGPIRVLLFHFPNIVRIYHEPQNILKDIANCDVYEWEVRTKDLEDLKALVRG